MLGGERFHGPVLIDGDVLDYLASLAVMEPSHQPYEVAAARSIAGSFPGLHQVACFDRSGGLDALVFTAGIGENSAKVRAAVCAKLGWLGVAIDPAANKKRGPLISAKDSNASVWVIPTNEELMIAMHTQALAASKQGFVS